MKNGDINAHEYKCAYCGAENVPLEIEHIVPKARSGSNRISNLTIACRKCNQEKSDRPIEEFLQGREELLKKIQNQAKKSLKDAAAMNATRKILLDELKKLRCKVYTRTGARTKWNRMQFGVPKEHWLDALCVGDDVSAVSGINKPVLEVECTGRGLHQRVLLDSVGFPRAYRMRKKQIHGFMTGDMVYVNKPKGKDKGIYVGRVAIRKSGSFDVTIEQGKKIRVSWKYCRLISRNDGYKYSYKKSVQF